MLADKARAQQLREERHVVDALRSAGYDVETIWDLTDVEGDRREAVTILMQQFPLSVYGVRSTIAHVLAMPEAREHWNTIVAFYRAEKEIDGKESFVKKALAYSMCRIADDGVAHDVVQLAIDPSQGGSRALLFPFLAKSSPQGTEALRNLSLDPVLGRMAQVAIRAVRMGKL